MAADYKFILQSSCSLAIVLFLLHAGALLTIIVLSTSWKFIMVVGIVIAVSFVFTLFRHVLLSGKNTIKELNFKSSGEWELIDKTGRSWRGSLHNSSIRTPLLVLLNFKLAHNFFLYSIIIPRDALKYEEFRRLRVLLLTQR